MKKILLSTYAFIVAFSLYAPFVNLTPSAFNMYSPELIFQGGQLVMYSGGWPTVKDIPHDAIYRAVCPTYNNCNPAYKVLDAAPLYQVNDPTIVQMPGGYWIMYLTGNTGTQNNIYFTTSWDGITWGVPTLLITGYWLPSAIVKDGKVYLYAQGSGHIMAFDLGASGVSVSAPIYTNAPNLDYYWINVDVIYHPSLNLWQMVGENLDITGNGNSSKFIDYLYSYDGTNWNMGVSHVIEAPTGGSVRTPAMHPNSAYYVYFGCSPTRDGMSNQICFQDWSK